MAGFYSARGRTIPPLPWTNFAPPLSAVSSNKPYPQFMIIFFHVWCPPILVDTSCTTELNGKRCGEIRAYVDSGGILPGCVGFETMRQNGAGQSGYRNHPASMPGSAVVPPVPSNASQGAAIGLNSEWKSTSHSRHLSTTNPQFPIQPVRARSKSPSSCGCPAGLRCSKPQLTLHDDIIVFAEN